ncbi:hypothetical protein E2320_000233 [Naja naja]|nr:hypothetical protein E2320_000233 [Naja naja]
MKRLFRKAAPAHRRSLCSLARPALRISVSCAPSDEAAAAKLEPGLSWGRGDWRVGRGSPERGCPCCARRICVYSHCRMAIAAEDLCLERVLRLEEGFALEEVFMETELPTLGIAGKEDLPPEGETWPGRAPR